MPRQIFITSIHNSFCTMGDSNNVLEGGTGKTEDHKKTKDPISLVGLVKQSLKPKLHLQ